jgi:hypothetical protein
MSIKATEFDVQHLRERQASVLSTKGYQKTLWSAFTSASRSSGGRNLWYRSCIYQFSKRDIT